MKPYRTLLGLALLALAGALLAQALLQDAGFVLVRYLGTTLETTLFGGALLLGGAVLVAWLAWRLLSWPFRAWRLRRERDARARLADGIDALHQGRYADAERLLAQACEDPQFRNAARIAAARAARAQGKDTDAQAHLDAVADTCHASRAIAIAAHAVEQGRHADALEALDAIPPGTDAPRAVALTADALAGMGRTADALALVERLREARALPAEAIDARERTWAAQALREAADADALADLWAMLDARLHLVPAIAAAYADRAAAMRWDDAAAGCLERALEVRWDEGLALHYALLPLERPDPAALERRRVQSAAWVGDHPASPGALLALARVLRQQGQWPQAEPLLHRAIAQGAGSEAWEELGHGASTAGDHALAALCHANALRAQRGEATAPVPGRDLRQQILDAAAIEERDAHGLPRLRG